MTNAKKGEGVRSGREELTLIVKYAYGHCGEKVFLLKTRTSQKIRFDQLYISDCRPRFAEHYMYEILVLRQNKLFDSGATRVYNVREELIGIFGFSKLSLPSLKRTGDLSDPIPSDFIPAHWFEEGDKIILKVHWSCLRKRLLDRWYYRITKSDYGEEYVAALEDNDQRARAVIRKDKNSPEHPSERRALYALAQKVRRENPLPHIIRNRD